jgi:hypothetical protein
MYAYTLPHQIAPVPVQSRTFDKAIAEVRSELWDTRVQQDSARIYRLADGWRFMGVVTYDGRFIDERVSA